MPASGPLVAILPGSRTQEVKSNFGYFLEGGPAGARARAERAVRRRVVQGEPGRDGPRAACAASSLPIEVHVGRTAELIAASECTMAVSGSVSLELLYHTKPTVILYYISPLAFFLQKFFRKVRYITLVNLLVTDDLFPKKVAVVRSERPGRRQGLDAGVSHLRGQVARRWPSTWSNGSPTRRSGPSGLPSLPSLRSSVGYGGASKRAADYMLAELDRIADRPHAADALPLRHAPGRGRPRRRVNAVAFSGGACAARCANALRHADCQLREQAPPLIGSRPSTLRSRLYPCCSPNHRRRRATCTSACSAFRSACIPGSGSSR